jgi:hypothetical protein
MNRQHVFDLPRELKASSALANAISLGPAEFE